MRKLLDVYDAAEHAPDPALPQSRGIVLRGLQGGRSSSAVVQAVLEQLDARDLAAMVQTESGLDGQGRWLRLWLAPCSTQVWAPGHDTMHLAETLGLATQASAADLQREILLTLLMTFFPLLLASISGFQILDQRLLYLTQSMGASTWQTFWYLRFPAALPVIFSGIKTSATIAALVAASKQRSGSASSASTSSGVGSAAPSGTRTGPIERVWLTSRMPSSARNERASAPRATRAAVSRALARSRIGRASSKSYFCMPTRSA